MTNLTCDGWVRHTDLYFRSLYPYINTTIYEVMNQYIIVVKKEQLLIDDNFKKYFHNSIVI